MPPVPSPRRPVRRTTPSRPARPAGFNNATPKQVKAVKRAVASSSTPTNQTVNPIVRTPEARKKKLELNKKLAEQATTGRPMKMSDRPKAGSREDNADRHGFTSKRRRSGGTASGSGSSVGGVVGSRPRSGGGGGGGGGGGSDDIASGGARDGGRLGGAFKDQDLVGSDNTIEDFDGTGFSGGGSESAGGGGGSGSALAGREAAGLANVKAGDSVEDVVYGVRKRRGKVSKARGE